MILLAIFAHPDDEAFACGGTLAKYGAQGHEVFLICATRGEEGEIIHPEIDAEKYPKGTARGKLREGELSEACKALGIQPPIFLNHADSGFPVEVGCDNPKAFMNQDVFGLEKELLEHIRTTKPDILISFDPHGMYGHIDHITIHRAALAAFWSAGGVLDEPPQRLFYPARSIEHIKHMKANIECCREKTQQHSRAPFASGCGREHQQHGEGLGKHVCGRKVYSRWFARQFSETPCDGFTRGLITCVVLT
jgi:N-acetyl-1-D-myo-inositol-2-amino-2-deoxy-alpha-D-glucopyranoside deacetylase